jgi:hypothetical protein
VLATLRRRLQRFERAAGGHLGIRLRACAVRLGIASERLSEIADEHKEVLTREIGTDGMVTWEGLCWLRDIGLFK